MTILDLSHNKLKGLAPEAFDKHSYSTELRLNNNQVIKVNIENKHSPLRKAVLMLNIMPIRICVKNNHLCHYKET